MLAFGRFMRELAIGLMVYLDNPVFYGFTRLFAVERGLVWSSVEPPGNRCALDSVYWPL